METSSDWMRRPNGVPSDGYYDERAVEAFRHFVLGFKPDAIVLETIWLHRYYDAIRDAGIPLILNSHNVEIDVARQVEAIETSGPLRLQRRILSERIRRVEEALVRAAEQIWLCSQEDGEIMRREYGITTPMHHVPNAVNPAEYQVACARPAEIAPNSWPVLLFPALYHYYPNVNAAHFLIHELLPRLGPQYPDIRLLLPGANPPPALVAEAKDPRVSVPGVVPEMLPYLRQSSVLAVPLKHGGGTRFKIIEAFAARLPVVSSLKGAEGLGAIPGRHYLRAETAEEFEAAVRQVLDHPARAAELVEEGARFAQQLWEEAGAAMRASIGAFHVS
ncbi:glycosyltransferase [Paludibaculum fermentans]|nr:glycosyltransferase [Paludibaculum fermentans]